jgi:hypothetical protein
MSRGYRCYEDWLVPQGVYSELVSAEFPVNQGKYREIFIICAIWQNSNPKTYVISAG